MSEEVYSLRKVIDPHRHMPSEIKDSFFEATRGWEKGNDSYIQWTVGEYEYDEEDEPYMAQLNKWLDLNFQKGESIIILHWW